MHAKGSTLHSTLAFVEDRFGADAAAAVLGRLPAAERARVRAATPTDEVPLDVLRALWRAVDAEVGERAPAWPEEGGAFAIDRVGVQMYGGILLKSSPEEFLTQRVSLFRLFYSPGDMVVAEVEPSRAVLRLVGFAHDEPVFCRRQTGGLLRSVQLAGGASAAVRHVRCTLEGDAFCEWELRWD